MPDLLTHALLGYVLGTLLAPYLDWPVKATTTVAMVGAILPDLAKIKLLIADAQMEALLAVPFSWDGLQTLGGVVLVSAAGSLLVEDSNRRRVFGLLLLGAIIHLALDSLLIKPSGFAKRVWWPMLSTPLPTPGLYHSSDRWPAVASALLAAIVWYRQSKRSNR